MVTTAGVHSVLGYRRMIVPLLRHEAGPLADPLTRRIIRFAWHATSVLMLISAAAVAWPGTPVSLLIVIGAGWLASGLFDAAYTNRSEEHTSELQSLMRISYAVFCLKKTKT